MKIFDFFRKKKKPEEPKKPKKEIKPEVKKEKVKPKTPVKKEADKKGILKTPHITEKATDLSKSNQYVFKVLPKSNKIEIKKTIERVYGVNVLSVNIVNIPSKRRRLGRTTGWKKGYKKAIVKIKQGQKIETL